MSKWPLACQITDFNVLIFAKGQNGNHVRPGVCDSNQNLRIGFAATYDFLIQEKNVFSNLKTLLEVLKLLR